MLGSWLTARVIDGVWGVGCSVCYHLGLRSEYAHFQISSCGALSLPKLLKHANSCAHKRAVAGLLGEESSHQVAAPSCAEFDEVLGDRLKMVSYRAGNANVGGAMRIQQMTWCLSEAIFEFDRQNMWKCESVTVHQDVRAPRLLIRFGASSQDFQKLIGVLGMAKQVGTTSSQLKEATTRIVKQFCSTFEGAPGKPKIAPQLDAGLGS